MEFEKDTPLTSQIQTLQNDMGNTLDDWNRKPFPGPGSRTGTVFPKPNLELCHPFFQLKLEMAVAVSGACLAVPEVSSGKIWEIFPNRAMLQSAVKQRGREKKGPAGYCPKILLPNRAKMVLCSFHRRDREICTRNRPLSEAKFLDDFWGPLPLPAPWFTADINQRISGTGKGKPARNPWSTLPEHCPHHLL